MVYDDSHNNLQSDGAFATIRSTVEAENEPFLAESDLATPRTLRSLSSDDSSATRRHRTRSDTAVRTRLLHALPLRLSQWLTASTEADGHGHGRRRSPAASPSIDATAASTLQVPVTLRVLPGNAPRLASASRPRGSSTPSLHEILVDTEDSGPLLPQREEPPSTTPSLPHHQATSPVTSPRSTTSSDDQAPSDDLSTLDEFHTLFRRCHHTLPFVALFLLYFVYQHIVGLAVCVLGSIAIAGLDQRLRAQIALKEQANRLYLVGIMAVCMVDTIVVSGVDGEPNPFTHLTHRLTTTHPDSDAHDARIVDLLWLVLVNDFIIRFWSLAVKAFVAAVGSDVVPCNWRRATSGSPDADGPVSPDHDLEGGSRRKFSRSNVTFYRRKRKLYGIIELTSIVVRSLLAGLPWCSYYQLCSSKFMADVFTFFYVFGKSVVLGSQGRQLLTLVRSFLTLGLDHATYVSRDELAEAGSSDCSICYEPMEMPVKLVCSHLFCEECVMEWLDRERSCPLCRAAIASPSSSENDSKPQYLDGSTSLFPQLF